MLAWSSRRLEEGRNTELTAIYAESDLPGNIQRINREPLRQAAGAALEASRYETIRCSPSSHRQHRKHAMMS